MSADVPRCYDDAASWFHLIFGNWEASIARQAAAMGPLLERECGESRPLRILDCGCGIGTQSIGLAARGHEITGCDISGAAVLRLQSEARHRGLTVTACTADMRDLSGVPGDGFDAVISLDNCLPHLVSDEDLLAASRQIRSKLRPGGVFAASIRDYDQLRFERPVVQGPAFYTDDGRRRIVHQVWDWHDERHYTFHLYLTLQAGAGWESHHVSATYRAVLRDELSRILECAEFAKLRWLLPEESGFYQPLVLASNA